jgi:hypothetical protein
MAKLIVTRPRLGPFWDGPQSYQILIDGHRVASVRPGETVEIELPPGLHQVRSRVAWSGSQPFAFEAGPGGIHHLAVGPELRSQKLLAISMVLAALPMLGLPLWEMSHGPRNAMTLADRGLLLPTMMLPLLTQLAFLVLLSDHCLVLLDVTGHDLTEGQIAEYMRSHQPRVRITLWQMMIAIALLALYLGASVEWSGSERSDRLRVRAGNHATSEAMFRRIEQDWSRIAVSSGATGPNASFTRQAAARAAARADYHAAMRRKYEEAAARRAFFVEPDPPEPPWP